eukprot:7387673-Prymnesium_polylepis.2
MGRVRHVGRHVREIKESSDGNEVSETVGAERLRVVVLSGVPRAEPAPVLAVALRLVAQAALHRLHAEAAAQGGVGRGWGGPVSSGSCRLRYGLRDGIGRERNIGQKDHANGVVTPMG